VLVFTLMVQTSLSDSSIKSAHEPLIWFLGAFDAADVVSMCGGNDGKLWDWWWADVISTRHMNNKN